ncbi:DUF4837 family protein [Tunicatimonas pelagia]|nr:DUF4837 family protein [Tunicatimonas pelagia]WKN41460.1 DUF4837 family protein [Tunicatimonas pelagia]
MLTYLRSLSFFTLIIIGLASCEGSRSSSESALPLARGAAGEIILVMDSTAWRGELGDELRQVFMQDVPGLPQPEPYFDLRYVNPFKLNDVLRSAKNMIFVTTLDNRSASGERMRRFFTESSLTRIESDSTFFSYPISNVFARGQKNLYLFGVSEDILLENLRVNRKQVRQHFSDTERNRNLEALYKSGEQRALERELLKDHSFYLRIPQDYDLVPLEDSIQQFVWLRQLGQVGEPDISIVVTYQEYTSEEIFQPEGIMGFREETLGKYIVDDNPPAYMTIQELEPIVYDTINFNGKFAIEARGLWKLSNITMGGPFLSYSFVDEVLNRFYYIEGYVYHPSNNKRTQIREVETILRTFQTEAEYQDSQPAN